MATSDVTIRTLPSLHEFFAPGGILRGRRCPRIPPRPTGNGQGRGAVACRATPFDVEAGTGTGKTLAYLLPALRTGQRVIVSTGTKRCKISFSSATCRSSRRCSAIARLLHEGARQLPLPAQAGDAAEPAHSSGLEEIDQYRRLRSGSRRRKPATVRAFRLAGVERLVEQAGCAHRGLLGSTCPDYRRCFITEMRRRAGVGHHHREPPLFFCRPLGEAGAAGAPDAGILPEAAAVIFDEAHELEEVASNYFGLSISNLRFEELARDMETQLRGKEGAGRLPASPSSSAIDRGCSSPGCRWRETAANRCRP